MWDGVRFTAKIKDFSLLRNIHIAHWRPVGSLSNDFGGLLPLGLKHPVCEVDHSLPLNAEVKVLEL
jgi:hypothetical protein